MKGRVLTSDLRRLAYNALLYSSKHSVYSGDVIWIRGAHGVRVVSTDDYFVIIDRADATEYSGAPETQVMDTVFLKQLEKDLREEKDEYFDLEMLPTCFPEDHEEAIEALEEADVLAFEVDQWQAWPISTFAVAPDRLRKLSLVKPGEYPIDIRSFGPADNQLLGFRIGPTVRGLISPLDRDHLKELYDGEELWGA